VAGKEAFPLLSKTIIILKANYQPMSILDDFKVLERNGFKPLPYRLVKDEEGAIKAAKRIGYPVAMKIVSDAISHKSDIGGVKVGIKNSDSLRHAYQEVMENVSGKKVEGMLIQKMARKGMELIIGGKKDPQFGHMVVLGLGGIYVEIFRDVTARICPVTEDDIEEMIGELKAHPLIEGARGEKPINKKALKKMVLDVCRLITKEDLSELDLNPVIFDEKGGDIIDVRFSRWRP
jgi:acetyl-CoA synthetase (ADP-forming)